MRLGWHYTDARLLDSILTEGLSPYKLRDELLLAGRKGVMLWYLPQDEAQHLGVVLDRFGTFNTTRVAVLEVLYDETLALGPDEKSRPYESWEDKFSFSHGGHWTHPRAKNGGYVYHEKEPFVIVLETIAPEYLRLVGVVDLLARVALAELHPVQGRAARIRELERRNDVRAGLVEATLEDLEEALG